MALWAEILLNRAMIYVFPKWTVLKRSSSEIILEICLWMRCVSKNNFVDYKIWKHQQLYCCYSIQGTLLFSGYQEIFALKSRAF